MEKDLNESVETLQEEIIKESESLPDDKPKLEENSQATLEVLDISLDADDEAKDIEKENKKLNRKTKAKKVAILVLVAIIIILLLKSCSGGIPDAPVFEDSDYVEQVNEPEHVDGYTAIPVVDDFTVTKSKPYIALYNPETNEGYSYLQYRFTDISTGEVIYESNLVKAGQKFSVAFGEMLEIGEHEVLVEILNFDYNDYTQRKNGAESQITITVKP